MNGYDHEDYGQVDGDDDDSGGAVNFTPAGAGQPWLREGLPPWHMWGNTQRLELFLPLAVSSGIGSELQRGQLIKISYKRPETWHWLFTCKFISGDAADALEPLRLSLVWELTVGIGRSMQQNLGFDNYNFDWVGAPAPVGSLIWTTETYGFSPNRTQLVVQPPNLINSIVAQDIQLNVRASLGSSVTPRAADKRAVIEVGAQFAPKSHIRPDWFQGPKTPAEVLFAGAETAGK